MDMTKRWGIRKQSSNIEPIKALVYAAIINGVITVPILFAIMRISNDKRILNKKNNGRISNIIGWITFATNAASFLAMFIS